MSHKVTSRIDDSRIDDSMSVNRLNKTYIYLINEMKIFIKNLESDKNSNQGFNNDSLIKSLREAINFLQNNEPKMYAFSSEFS